MKPSLLTILALILLMLAGWFIWDSVGPSPDKESPDKKGRAEKSSNEIPTSSTSSRKQSANEIEFDWANVASELRKTSRRLDKLKPSTEIEKAIARLSRHQLLEARNAVFNSDLELRDKDYLLRYLTTCYVQRDPEGYLRDNQGIPPGRSSQLWWERFALSEWARQSSEDAINWLKNEAPESRDAKQLTRLDHNLFSTLLVVDFAKATEYYLNTPNVEQYKLIQNFDGFGSYWRDEDFEHQNIAGRYAEIARLRGPVASLNLIGMVTGVRGEQDRPEGISRIQENLTDWDKARGKPLPATTLADYLDKINATPEEEAMLFKSMVGEFRYYLPDGDQEELMSSFTEEVRRLRSPDKHTE
ncbi:MAG: hypothetical protein ACON38_14990 [Akkermansiaceae bacterium]